MIFTIAGDPRGKQRPRFNGKTGSAYTPSETVAYEKRVKYGYVMEGGKKLVDVPVRIEVWAFFRIPTSISKKKQEAMVGQPATKKPDIDNILKIVLDGLNGAAYDDDKQVVQAMVHKCYWPEPKVTIEVREL